MKSGWVVGLLSITFSATAAKPDGGGIAPLAHDHQSPAEIARIERLLERNVAELTRSGRLKRDPAAPKVDNLAWPLRASAAYTAPLYEGVSNFVDLNPAVPDQLLDFSCGRRSYDLPNGYNHAGIDYFLWPFAWRMMDAGVISVVAAAPGTIIGKEDGNDDRSCRDHYSDNWNAVYVQHGDGTVAWYGHLRTDSLTDKPVGGTVATGEYLGLVGSSGFSTGPHLHLELRGNATQAAPILEPHAGQCRSGTSLWASQRPYFDSRVSMLATHSAPPNFTVPCPNPTQEQPNFKNRFNPGELALFAAYYRDQQRGQSTDYRVIRPNGTVWQSWQHAPNEPNWPFYAASYWYWSYTLPTTPTGTWAFETTYQGRIERTTFVLGPEAIFSNGFN
jgi:murein DD-endopeptidase MepM/ murein hydrolase activator NlpD